MAIAPMFRSPSRSILDFADERAREAASIGSVITNLARPYVEAAEPTPTMPVPQPLNAMPMATPQPLGTVTGPKMAPTLVEGGVSPEFMDRLFTQESGNNPNAVSSKGAIGLGQVLPSTAMDPGYGVPTIFDLADEQGIDYSGRTLAEAERLLFNEDLNRQMSTNYANAMDAEFGGNSRLTAAAYNAGPGAVMRYGGVPPYEETQNYANIVGGAGDTRLGGGAGEDRLGAGFNVEDILAQLYPTTSPEDERVQRRRDLLAGAGDILMGLSQGVPADISYISARQEERKRQAVLDMRERERARAAASLVYAQTNDADMAAAVASGAINVETAFNERERRRIEKEADKQRLQQEAAAGNLADLFISVAPDLGMSEEQIAKITEGIKAGTPLDTLMSPIVLQKTAEASRLAEETAATAKEQRDTYTQALLESDNPVERAAGQFLLGDPEMSVKDAMTTANTVYGVSAKDDPVSIAEAKLLFEGGAINPQTQQPFTSAAEALAAIQFYKAPTGGAGTSTVQLSPDGSLTITTQPQAAGGAGVVGGELGTTPAGTATVQGPEGLVNVPVPGAIPPQQAAVDLATAKQKLDQEIAAAPSALEKAKLEAQKLQLEVQEAQARQDVDAATREATLAGLEADAAKKAAEVEALKREQALESSVQYQNAVQQFMQLETAATTIADNADSGWATGVAGGVSTTIANMFGIPTLRTEVLSAAKQIGSQAMLNALQKAKEAGLSLTPMSNFDSATLGASESPLLEPETLRGDKLLSAAVDRYNYVKDQLLGPKDLTRLDQYGNEYTLGQNTLGISENEFSFHWAQIPPEVAAAWKNGDIPVFPTDNPEYEDAATALNAMTANWELYQGDLDRSAVGEAEAPAEPTDLADLPPPPSNVPAEEWAETWQYMSQSARDKYIKQMQGEQ